MEDDLPKKWKQPQKKIKMEDNLIFFWKTKMTT
jgi:hypothetical protein